MQITKDKTDKNYDFILLNEAPSLKKNIYTWTEDEKELLKELYPNHSNKELSIILNKTKASIDKKAHLLGLKKSVSHRKKVSLQNNKKKRQAWKEEEINILKTYYKTKSYSDIAEILNRTTSSVSQKVRKLILTKYKRSNKKRS